MVTIMKKIMALDIGNVCFKIDTKKWIDKLGIRADNIQLIRNISAKQVEFELGLINQNDFLEILSNLTGNTFSSFELIGIFCSIIEGEIVGMYDLMIDLVNSSFKIMFLSDISSLHLGYVHSRLSFANLVIGGVYSFEVGALKPDNKIFNEFERRYGKPDIYIDDLEENCIAAQKNGWDSHCFVTSENCRKELSQIITFP